MVLLPPFPEGKFPALVHTSKVIEKLAPSLAPGRHVLLLVSHSTPFRNDTDREMPHRPESNFMYLTGCDVPGAALTVSFELTEGGKLVSDFRHTLFVPPANEDDIMWSVPPPSLEVCAKRLSSHAFEPLPALERVLSAFTSTSTVHTLPSTVLFPALPSSLGQMQATRAEDALLPALHQARLLKTEHEIALMARANAITSQAHEVVMRALGRHAAGRGVAGAQSTRFEERGVGAYAAEWEIEGEGDAEALFVAACRRGGSKHLSYMPIIASGSRASTLHYICNHAPFVHGALPTTLDSSAFLATAPVSSSHGHTHDGPDPLSLGAKGDWQPQVLLIDAGTETDCYGADITRTMPVGNGGRFTTEARAIYSLVLHMQKEAEKMTRAGVHWDTIQLATHRLLVRGFLELGIFRGGDEETILQSGVSTGFFPHGLGHSIGLDVHDVPSASKPDEATNTTIPAESRQTPELYAFLRLRLPLAAGMLITIEPGCYFSPHLLRRWRDSEFIDPAVLARYEPVGGVRIEDVVLVERDGCRNLTGAVREVADVERLCSGA